MGLDRIKSMWRFLIDKKKLTEISDTEKRALELRETCVGFAGITNRLLNDPGVKDDVPEFAQMMVTFRGCSLNLQTFGITKDKPERPDGSLLSIAEDAGRLWADVRFEDIPFASEEIRRLQELGKDQLSVENKYTAPFSDKWQRMNEITRLTFQLLGTDPDKLFTE